MGMEVIAIGGFSEIGRNCCAIKVDDEIVIRPMMYLAFSYDHRIIDGKESVGFLVSIKSLLENPSKLILGV